MATSTIEMPTKIHDIKLVLTTINPSGSLEAYSGASGTITPTAPSGYHFLTHITIWNFGAAGVVVSFDGQNAIFNETASFYQYNVKNSKVTNRGYVNLLTAYYK